MGIRGFVTILLGLAVYASTMAKDSLYTPGSYDDPLYQGISRAVVRLEHVEVTLRVGADKSDTAIRSDGTGFVVRYRDITFLVTARHVAQAEYELFARITIRNPATDDFEIARLRVLRKAWVFHPAGGSDSVHAVDVAAAIMPGGRPDMAIQSFQESMLKGPDPSPPSEVLVFGFPYELGMKLRWQRPVARAGIVALVSGERFLSIGRKYADERTFLMDAPVFPGNSGSPVFSNREIYGEARLVGLVNASQQTLDYALCEPISRILETLERAIAAPLAERVYPVWVK